MAAEASTDERAWVWVEGLQPDTDYRYRVVVDGSEWAADELWAGFPSPGAATTWRRMGRLYDLRFRTWPHPDDPTPPLRFVAMVLRRGMRDASRVGGSGTADVLERLVSDHDVRFVLSLGDNIYQGEQGRRPGGRRRGRRLVPFQPYRLAIARVPVLPAIGNHDSTDWRAATTARRWRTTSTSRSASTTASRRPRSCRDSSTGCATEPTSVSPSALTALRQRGRADPPLLPAPHHQEWLRQTFHEPAGRWVIPFSHHPVYTAGPNHENDEEMREALEPLFDATDVRLVLAYHEHNYQVSQVNDRAYVVSGASGQLDERVPHRFAESHTTAWAAQAHLLLIELDAAEARITPISGLMWDGRLHP